MSDSTLLEIYDTIMSKEIINALDRTNRLNSLMRKPVERKRKDITTFEIEIGKTIEKGIYYEMIKHNKFCIKFLDGDRYSDVVIHKKGKTFFGVSVVYKRPFDVDFILKCNHAQNNIVVDLNELMKAYEDITRFRIYKEEDLNTSMIKAMKQSSVFRLHFLLDGNEYSTTFTRVKGVFSQTEPVRYTMSNITNSTLVNKVFKELLKKLNTNMTKVKNSGISGLKFSDRNAHHPQNVMKRIMDLVSDPNFSKNVHEALDANSVVIESRSDLFNFVIDPKKDNLMTIEQLNSRIRSVLRKVRELRSLLCSSEEIERDFTITVKGDYDAVYSFKGNNLVL